MTDRSAEAIRRLVFDTSTYSRMRVADDRVLDLLARAEVVLLPVTVLGELEAAFEYGARARENRVALAEFLDESFVSTLPTTIDVARRYGELFVELRRAGTPIPTNDVWIAAATVDCGGHLLTFDGHFEKVKGLKVTRLTD